MPTTPIATVAAVRVVVFDQPMAENVQPGQDGTWCGEPSTSPDLSRGLTPLIPLLARPLHTRSVPAAELVTAEAVGGRKLLRRRAASRLRRTYVPRVLDTMFTRLDIAPIWRQWGRME
jgi:hypothetical protein